MRFENDTNIRARFDYYEQNNNAKHLTVVGGGQVDIENIAPTTNLGVTLFNDKNQQVGQTLYGILTPNSSIAGVIMGADGQAKLSIA